MMLCRFGRIFTPSWIQYRTLSLKMPFCPFSASTIKISQASSSALMWIALWWLFSFCCVVLTLCIRLNLCNRLFEEYSAQSGAKQLRSSVAFFVDIGTNLHLEIILLKCQI